ncbi:MAG TPA: hypothetical protein VGD22_18200 [Sphingobacteriaceae bacterium]
MQRILYNIATIVVVFIILSACGTRKNSNASKQEVPVEINIKSDNNSRIAFVNLDIYRFRLLDELRGFQSVYLTLADENETPEIVVDITIDNFILWPKDERTSRQVFRRNIQTGTNSAGKPVYETVSASVDITQTQIRSSARFIARITFKASTPPVVFERSFSPNYQYNNISTSNIQGDIRALDPRLISAGAFNMEPTEEEFLLALSNQELTRRISTEIRKHYQ